MKQEDYTAIFLRFFQVGNKERKFKLFLHFLGKFGSGEMVGWKTLPREASG